MSTVTGKIVDYKDGRVRIENEARDMRLWFSASDDLPTNDFKFWIHVNEFILKDNTLYI